MNAIETLATFFGWCIVINIGFMLALLVRGIVVRKLSAKVGAGRARDFVALGLSPEEVKAASISVFLQYRTATLVLSVTPYGALKIMA